MKKLNVKLLRKVQKHILAEPRRLNMNVVVGKVDTSESPCGTVGCIAGWTCILSGVPEADTDLRKAQSLLGLTREQRDRLFAEPRYGLEDYDGTSYEAVWPKSFARRYENARTQKTMAKIAAGRIDHFIATKGAE